MSFKRLLLHFAAGTALLTLAACGGGSGGGGSGAGDTDPPPAAPGASTEQERFDARIAQNDARRAKEAAITAVGDAVEAAETAADEAAKHAMYASGSATRAGDARTDSGSASTASMAASAQSTAAMTAMDNANQAQTALGDAIAAYDAVVADQDINTKDGANAIKGAAMTLETATNTAKAAAEGAQTAAETARDMAMSYASKADMSADTPVLYFFKQANAYDIEDPIDDVIETPANEAMTVDQQRKPEVASIGAVMATAAGATGGNQRDDAATSVLWPSDDPATTTTDEDEEFPVITVTGLSVSITSDLDGTPAENGNAAVPANAKRITGVDGFMHGYDMMMDQVRVIAFTDREKQVRAATAVMAANIQNVAVDMPEKIVSLGESTDGGKTYPGTFSAGDNGNVMGTFTCSETCTLIYTGTGDDVDVASAMGVTFSGRRAAKAAVTLDENMDYLLFGLWLDEDDQGVDSFGAFGGGGDAFATAGRTELTGTASYSGEAVGARHKTGKGISWFEGDASLTAKFGSDTDLGTIGGSISNISVAGGDALADPIHLVQTDLTDNSNVFSGTSTMGLSPDAYVGTWSGGFFNDPVAPADGEDALTGDAMHPRAVAGTFGVTRDTMMGEGDDETTITESFVGAFGATNDDDE